MDLEVLSLDGSHLEGGGQLLRVALSLSALTGKGIRVHQIRANRQASRGKTVGGLKKSHYECVKLLASITGAETQGMHVGSSTLLFRPALEHNVSLDEFLDRKNLAHLLASKLSINPVDLDRGALEPRRLRVSLQTAGSVYLVVQALLPYILLGPFSRPRRDAKCMKPPPVHLTVRGGTNVSHAPSHEYTSQVLLPSLSLFFNVSPIKATLKQRGWSVPWYTGRENTLGEVSLEIQPNDSEYPLIATSTANKSPSQEGHFSLTQIDLGILAHPKSLIKELEKELRAQVELTFPHLGEPELPVNTIVSEDSGHPARVYILVVCRQSLQVSTADGSRETSMPEFRLGHDFLASGHGPKRNNFARKTAAELIAKVKCDLDRGALIDEYLQDQLVVFQALSQGRSEISRGSIAPSLHTQTARWVAQAVLSDIKFEGTEMDGASICEGISFEPGAKRQEIGAEYKTEPERTT